ncbi:MAG TPA: hypothetical protein VE153_29355, partial [Myxococcus sp.]|nr:hypothetical protein [Myxococcus sp.]
PNGPMCKQSGWVFDADENIRGTGINVVLNAAHRQVKCTQTPDADSTRFPFETFFRNVSRAGAACFLAHHHPDERFDSGFTKNDSYSNWGMYAGQGNHSDWMDVTNSVTEIAVQV